MTRPTNETLIERAKALKLYGLIEHWEELGASPPWVDQLLQWEEAERARRSLQRRLRTARIGRFKPITDFDWTWPAQCDRAAVEESMSLS